MTFNGSVAAVTSWSATINSDVGGLQGRATGNVVVTVVNGIAEGNGSDVHCQ